MFYCKKKSVTELTLTVLTPTVKSNTVKCKCNLSCVKREGIKFYMAALRVGTNTVTVTL